MTRSPPGILKFCVLCAEQGPLRDMFSFTVLLSVFIMHEPGAAANAAVSAAAGGLALVRLALTQWWGFSSSVCRSLSWLTRTCMYMHCPHAVLQTQSFRFVVLQQEVALLCYGCSHFCAVIFFLDGF